MSVSFTPSHPANTASVGKSVDVQTLQEAFAVALRNYGMERGSFTDTMLEVLRAPHANNAAGDDQNQRQEHQQQADRNDFTNIDRKQLDRSEIRSSDMNSAYRDRIDRNETLRNDYRERIERSESQQSAVQTSPSSPTTPSASSLDVTRPSEPMQTREHSSPQQNVPPVVSTNNQPLSANVPSSVPNIGLANVVMSGGNVPASMPTPIAPQVVPPQAFTIFTPSGRFGQTQRKTGNKEHEEEESVEGKEPKKQKPFAEFEAIQAEATRQTRQNLSRQSKELIPQPELQQVAEKPREKSRHEKPREVEPDQSRNVKTLEEFLNTPAQNVSVQKRGEPDRPNQMQYLNRIAAACEAASYYAPIRIKINLDHLGTLTLRFFHKADKLMLRFETPSRESAQFLRDHLDGLRTILSKRNVKIADIEILVDA